MVTLEEVHTLARLARIALSDEQAQKMQAEISAILGFVEQLNVVKTDNLEPTYQVSGHSNVTRPDEVIDYGVNPEELLKNAPESEGGSIKVRRVL